MKSTIKENEKADHPIIGLNANYNENGELMQIILVSNVKESYIKGTVVWHIENPHLQPVGYYSENWLTDEFVPFDGSVTLEN